MNYKRLGDYIELSNSRNTNLKYEERDVRGVSNDKRIIKSKANNKGRSFENFYIVKSEEFIYNSRTSRMGDKVGLGFNETNKTFITSFNNTAFRVKNNLLIPKYLFMWFNRPEFDRYVRFHSWGSSTEIFSWDEMCNTQLPIPSIEKQQQIITEYNTVTNRINLNNQLNQNLEATAQALYKHWFVDFEFPNAGGKSYKSSGGEMVYNEELDKDIPVGWSVKGLSSIADYLNGAAMQKFPSNSNNNYTPVLKIRELNLGKTDGNSDKAAIDIPEKYKMQNGDVIFSWSGTLAIDIWTGGYAGLNQHLFKVSSDDFPKWYYYLSTKLYIEEFKRIADGNKTSMGHIKREHLDNSFISYPNENFNSFNAIFEPLISKVESNKLETQTLKELQSLLLAKMTQQETKAQVV